MSHYLFSFLFPFIFLLLIMPLSNMACSLSPEGQRVIEKAQEALQRHQGQEPSGQPILIKLDTAYFLSYPKEGNHQVKVLVNYTLANNSFISANANAVLKIYARNGTLLKTSSFPSGFILENNGTKQLLTNIPYKSIENITAVIGLTNQNKTFPLSNSLNIPLTLGKSLAGH
jgi:hypothetical protein